MFQPLRDLWSAWMTIFSIFCDFKWTWLHNLELKWKVMLWNAKNCVNFPWNDCIHLDHCTLHTLLGSFSRKPSSHYFWDGSFRLQNWSTNKWHKATNFYKYYLQCTKSKQPFLKLSKFQFWPNNVTFLWLSDLF